MQLRAESPTGPIESRWSRPSFDRPLRLLPHVQAGRSGGARLTRTAVFQIRNPYPHPPRHEVAINELMRETRKTQVAEAKQNLKTLQQSLKSAGERVAYFGSRKKIFPGEQDALDRQGDAHIATMVSEGLRTASAIAHAFPNAITGVPIAAQQHGGTNLGNALGAGATVSNNGRE